MLKYLVGILFLVVLIKGDTQTKPLFSVPQELSNKQGCFVPEANDVVPVGESVAPVGICTKIECNQESLTYTTCSTSAISDPSKCYATDVDYSRPYPTCCPAIQCDIGPSVPED